MSKQCEDESSRKVVYHENNVFDSINNNSQSNDTTADKKTTVYVAYTLLSGPSLSCKDSDSSTSNEIVLAETFDNQGEFGFQDRPLDLRVSVTKFSNGKYIFQIMVSVRTKVNEYIWHTEVLFGQ